MQTEFQILNWLEWTIVKHIAQTFKVKFIRANFHPTGCCKFHFHHPKHSTFPSQSIPFVIRFSTRRKHRASTSKSGEIYITEWFVDYQNNILVSLILFNLRFNSEAISNKRAIFSLGNFTWKGLIVVVIGMHALNCLCKFVAGWFWLHASLHMCLLFSLSSNWI